MFTGACDGIGVKVVEWVTLADDGYSTSREFMQAEADVRGGIAAVVWPVGSSGFAINPTRRGNGVVPIKDAFVSYLVGRGWVPEFERFDAHLSFPNGHSLPFAVEWETGNISSSHRAINRMVLGMIESRIGAGILVLPTRALYSFLTDRVGNIDEVRPYFPLWSKWSNESDVHYLAVVAIEHDHTDSNVALIRKGTDGRALV